MANAGGSYTADKKGDTPELVHCTQELPRDKNGKRLPTQPSASKAQAAPANKQKATD
jgi:hypothetical protein